MDKIKFTKGIIKYPTHGGEVKERKSYIIGDYSYGKMDYFYAVTHNPSGMLVLGNIIKISIAKELTFNLSLLPIKWNGLKKTTKKVC